MTIKNKLLILTSIIILVSILGVILFIYLITKVHIDKNIEVRAELYKQTFNSLLEIEKSKLEVTLKDYTNWGEVGEMAVLKNDKKWIEENIYPWVEKQFGFDFVLLVKRNGEVIINSFVDNINYEDFILKDEKKSKSGFYLTNRGLVLFATSGVFDNNGDIFYNAYLTFGYLINEKILNNFKNLLDMDIQLITKNYIISTDPNLKKFTLEEEKKPYQYIDNYICVFMPIYNNNGEKIAEFHIHKFDDIPSKIMNSIYYGVLIATILTFIAAFIINLLVVYNILKPLIRFELLAKKIAEGKYDIKLNFERNDEIGSLAKSFKKMVEKIANRESELRTEKEKLAEMSYKDPLTEIYNRKFFIEYVEKLISQNKHFSIVFLDLDNFKLIDDILGHKTGDEILKKIAVWFHNNLRKDDLVARYGGDEFCIVLHDVDKRKSEEIIERLYKLFTLETFYPEEIPIGFSFGIATYPDDADSLDKLLSLADTKMYKMKELRTRKEK
ncbi:MAG: diguanylate cyclase [Caldisericia bacterium]|nr:diguanylate cyclase [Caldisericia bacterium]